MKPYCNVKTSILFFLIVTFSSNLTFGSNSKINENDLLLINRLKSYEIDSHNNFEKELYQVSDKFIHSQSKKFVDDETGFFALWYEAFHYFESDIRKNARWKSRVDKYFRATEYTSYIKEKQSDYSYIINSQRKELLGKLHINRSNLNISAPNIDTINSSSEVISEVVDSVNKLVLTEVIPEAIESFVIPLIIWITGYVIANVFLITYNGSWIKRILFVLLLVISVWKSISYSNELEEHINRSFEIANKEHLNIKPLLIDNTNEYYNELNNSIK